MNESDAARQKWDGHYRDAADVPAMRVVAENLHLAPTQGRGLELACGLAGNAFLLAEHGLQMDAWDISPVAIERVNREAQRRGLVVHGAARDVMQQPLVPQSYDVIVATHFLERVLAPQICAALRPGGLLFYQTFTRTRISEGGPKKDEWRLADGELLQLFSELRVLVYREEGLVGNVQRGLRNEALLVAQKL
ncbi:MAG: class I SAM-dependent methyltransferase [Gammaproteobacteria bacterium]|nr:class I SAM-dependent methyltransferase [Gammaproteobacteria bacterium]